MSTSIVRKISTTVVTAGIVIGTIVGSTTTSQAVETQPELHRIEHTLPVWMTTPCEVEDGSDCYWDAETSGNGEGQSFYSVRTEPGTVCVRYWDVPADNFCTADAYPLD